MNSIPVSIFLFPSAGLLIRYGCQLGGCCIAPDIKIEARQRWVLPWKKPARLRGFTARNRRQAVQSYMELGTNLNQAIIFRDQPGDSQKN